MARGRVSRRQTGGRTKAAVFLLISLAAAVGATVVIFNMFKSFEEEIAKLEEKEETVTVVVAKRDLHPGETITADDITVHELADDFIPGTVFFEPSEVVNRVPRERILKFDLVRAERLAEVNAGVGLNAIIPKGMRAFSVDVTNASAVSGFINPGNYVDVLVTIKSERRKSETITLLQAAKVLAVNNRLGGDVVVDRGGQKVKPSVTLAVTAEDVEKLALAQSEGEMTLTLRSDVDVHHYETHGASANRIIGRVAVSPVEVEEPEPDGSSAPPTAPRATGSKAQAQEDETLHIIRGSKTEVRSTDSEGNVQGSSRRRRNRR